MTKITGSIGITGTASPKDTVEQFASIDPLWGIDGHRSVASVVERNAISPLRRRFGMTVTINADAVPGNNKRYILANAALGGIDNNLNNNSNWIADSSWNEELTRNTILSTLSIASNGGPISHEDSLIVAVARLQNQINFLSSATSWKMPADAATTANVVLEGEQTIDGVVLVSGDSVLVKDQSIASENGIYSVAVGAWTRRDDADTSFKLKGAALFVLDGVVNTDSQWVNSSNDIVLDDTSIVWVKNGATVTYASGPGISIIGNAISLAPIGSGKVFVGNSNGDTVAVDISGDATISNTGVLSLTPTGITPGVYAWPTLTVGADGRIEVIESGLQYSAGQSIDAVQFTAGIIAVDLSYHPQPSIILDGVNSLTLTGGQLNLNSAGNANLNAVGDLNISTNKLTITTADRLSINSNGLYNNISLAGYTNIYGTDKIFMGSAELEFSVTNNIVSNAIESIWDNVSQTLTERGTIVSQALSAYTITSFDENTNEENILQLTPNSFTLNGNPIATQEYITLDKYQWNLTPPQTPGNGMVYYDTALHQFRGFRNGEWKNFLMDGDASTGGGGEDESVSFSSGFSIGFK